MALPIEHALSFEQTVPRSLVHKRSLENVLLTEVRACGDNRFICAGRVPTAHRFFNDRGRTPRHDIFFYGELGRQASLAVSHACLNVSRDDVFIFEQAEAALSEAAWRFTAPSPADSVVVDMKIRDMTWRKNVVSRVAAEYNFSIGDDDVCRATGAWSVQSAALFQRLRRGSSRQGLPAPAERRPYESEARSDHLSLEPGENVVIAVPTYVEQTAEVVSALIVDPAHPYFFDHPCDHTPGMLLLEGCAQLAVATATGTAGARAVQPHISAYDVKFEQFVETDRPTALVARLTGPPTNGGRWLRSTVHVSISQDNVLAGTATMHVAVTA
jgi:2-oxo-3-(phosphooxy)propyl 3-oxoalkanoate synthase